MASCRAPRICQAHARRSGEEPCRHCAGSRLFRAKSLHSCLYLRKRYLTKRMATEPVRLIAAANGLLTSGALAKPGARSGTHNLLKCAGEMARVGKADERCDRCQRFVGVVHHESLRAPNASVHLPTLKRHARRVLERSAKLRG